MRTTNYAQIPDTTQAFTRLVRDDHGQLWLVVRSTYGGHRKVNVTGEDWAELRCPPLTPEEA